MIGTAHQKPAQAAGRIKFPPEVAFEHLRLSVSGFRDVKTRPSLDIALRHKDVLKA